MSESKSEQGGREKERVRKNALLLFSKPPIPGLVKTRLTVLKDGEEALTYLRRQGSYANATRPHLILLDLNLPRKDGREVLAQIKAEEPLKRIPVVVLTTSDDEQDVLKSYNLHANCYITKPVDLDQFIRVVRSIEDFWLGIVVLPVPPQNGTR